MTPSSASFSVLGHAVIDQVCKFVTKPCSEVTASAIGQPGLSPGFSSKQHQDVKLFQFHSFLFYYFLFYYSLLFHSLLIYYFLFLFFSILFCSILIYSSSLTRAPPAAKDLVRSSARVEGLCFMGSSSSLSSLGCERATMKNSLRRASCILS